MIEYEKEGDSRRTWTCTETDCRNCVGKDCSKYALTVSTEGAVSDLSPVSDCRYGDTVKLDNLDKNELDVREIAIIGKGKSNVCYSWQMVAIGKYYKKILNIITRIAPALLGLRQALKISIYDSILV